jgi:hypothetical protein
MKIVSPSSTMLAANLAIERVASGSSVRRWAWGRSRKYRSASTIPPRVRRAWPARTSAAKSRRTVISDTWNSAWACLEDRTPCSLRSLRMRAMRAAGISSGNSTSSVAGAQLFTGQSGGKTVVTLDQAVEPRMNTCRSCCDRDMNFQLDDFSTVLADLGSLTYSTRK